MWATKGLLGSAVDEGVEAIGDCVEDWVSESLASLYPREFLGFFLDFLFTFSSEFLDAFLWRGRDICCTWLTGSGSPLNRLAACGWLIVNPGKNNDGSIENCCIPWLTTGF